MQNKRTAKESSRPWIAYVGPIAFPDGDAGSRRVLGISRTLAALGYDVVVAGGLNRVAPVQSLRIGGQEVGAIEYVGMAEYDSNWSRVAKLRASLIGLGSATVRWLDQQEVPPAAVIIYGTPLPMLWRLRRWCRSRGVRLMADVVEWYNGSHMIGGRFGPLHLSNEYAMRVASPRCEAVIAISSFLCRHYCRHGVPVISIPPTLDVRAVECREPPSLGGRQLQLVYAGVPGKKDLLGNMVRAVHQADPDGSRIRLRIFGLSQEQLIDMCPDYPRQIVEAMGRRTHDEVVRYVAEADYSMLLRSDERYAHAGFSTKVVESMSCGTPVICNLTGDLGEHVTDGVTGIVCEDDRVDSLVRSVRTTLALNNDRRTAMRRAARDHALQAFDFRAFIRPLREFFERFGLTASAPSESPCQV